MRVDRRRGGLWWSAGIVADVVAVLTCRPVSETSRTMASGNSAVLESPRVYPKGRWRLADPVELSRAVLWLSHIFVRYHTPGPNIVPFSNGDWVHLNAGGLPVTFRCARRAGSENA